MRTMKVEDKQVVKLLSFKPTPEGTFFWKTDDGRRWLQRLKTHGAKIKFVKSNPYLKYKTTMSMNRGYSGGIEIANEPNAGWCHVSNAKCAPWDGKGVDIHVDYN